MSEYGERREKSNMVLSTTTSVLFHSFGYQEGIKLAARIGFDALDMNMCDLAETSWEREFSEEKFQDTCRKMHKTAAQQGIFFNQAHAPFPAYIFGDDQYNRKIRERIVRSIKITALLGAKLIVIHPIECPMGVDQKQFNMEFYNSLIPYCEAYGVKIALENLWRYNHEAECAEKSVCSNAEELAEYYEALPKEYFAVCLDVGHCEILGERAEDAIRKLGKDRLHALHIHDNDRKLDLHTIPYQGKLDWDAIMHSLFEIGYAGEFTYEVGGIFLRPYENKPILLTEAFVLMEKTGRELLERLR